MHYEHRKELARCSTFQVDSPQTIRSFYSQAESTVITTMLPFDNRDIKQGQGKTSLMEGKFPDYMRRLCDFRQMDFEAAFDQLLTLISLEPQQM